MAGEQGGRLSLAVRRTGGRVRGPAKAGWNYFLSSRKPGARDKNNLAAAAAERDKATSDRLLVSWQDARARPPGARAQRLARGPARFGKMAGRSGAKQWPLPVASRDVAPPAVAASARTKAPGGRRDATSGRRSGSSPADLDHRQTLGRFRRRAGRTLMNKAGRPTPAANGECVCRSCQAGGGRK